MAIVGITAYRGAREVAIITVRDCREFGYSPAGVKKFFEDHGLDWPSFLRNGIESDKVRQSGVALAIALADAVEERENRRNG